MRQLYTYIHLDYARVEFLSCIKKKDNALGGLNNFLESRIYLMYT